MSYSTEETSSDPQWYYRARGKDWGPFSTEGLLELVERGRLSRQDQVKLGEEGEWMLAGDVEDCVRRTQLAPPQTSWLPGIETCCALPTKEKTANRRGSRSFERWG